MSAKKMSEPEWMEGPKVAEFPAGSVRVSCAKMAPLMRVPPELLMVAEREME